MSDYNIQNPNISTVNGTQPAVSTASKTGALPVANASSNDETNLNTQNSLNTTPQTKRSGTELYKKIEALCAKYGISLAEVKKAGLMGRIAGVSEKELLNFPENEINKHIECLKAALEKLSKTNKEIDIEEVIKLANNYNVAIHTGWTIEGFEQKNKTSNESINERFKRFFGKKIDFEKLNDDEKYNLCKKYFDDYFKTQVKAGKKPEDVAKLQLQDFGKLLINTPDKDKDIFRKAFASLLSENKYPGLNAVFKSFVTEEGRTKFADSMQPKDLEKAYEPDIQGNRPSADNMTSMSDLTARNQSAQGRKEFHAEFNKGFEAFLEENKEVLERIDTKIKNGEELTKEEQQVKDKLDNYYTSVAAGEFTGTANSAVLDNDSKEDILRTLNSDAYNKPNYREIIGRVNEYVKEHPECLTMSEEEFTKLMDEVTEGNFTTVVNDSKNGTTTELNPPSVDNNNSNVPAQNQQNNSTQEQPDFGFSKPQRTVDPETAARKKEEIVTTSKPQSDEAETLIPKGDIVAATRTGDGFKNYLSENGARKTVEDVFNNLNNITNQGIINFATRLYTTFENMQYNILKSVNNTGLAELLKHTSGITFAKLDGETFTNFYATKMVKEKVEDYKELHA